MVYSRFLDPQMNTFKIGKKSFHIVDCVKVNQVTFEGIRHSLISVQLQLAAGGVFQYGTELRKEGR